MLLVCSVQGKEESNLRVVTSERENLFDQANSERQKKYFSLYEIRRNYRKYTCFLCTTNLISYTKESKL